MAAGLLSTILDTTGERVKERLQESHDLDKEMRDTQTKALLTSIFGVDENGNPKLSEAQAEEAWSRIEQLHKHNKATKDILAKGRDILGKIFGAAKPNQAMGNRAAEQTAQALSGGEGGALVSAPPQQTTNADPNVAETYSGLPAPPPRQSAMDYIRQGRTPPFVPEGMSQPTHVYAPPAGQEKQPIQQVAAAASLPPPPQRTSPVDLMRQGMPNPVRDEIAKEKRAAATEHAKTDRANEALERRDSTQHQYRMEEIEAQKKSKDDWEVDTFTNSDGHRVSTFGHRNPDGTVSTYTITSKDTAREANGAEKGLQDVEAVFFPGTEMFKRYGSHGPAFFNPDPDNPGYWITGPDGKKMDISSQVKGKYFQPSASIQLANAGEKSVDDWVNQIDRGGAKIGDVPGYIRNQVMEGLGKKGIIVTPPTIRERVVAISSAENLLKPIEDLVSQINAAPSLAEKAELSYLLNNATQSIGTMLARSLGEKGMATENDVARATGLVPGWKAANFAPEYAKREMDYLKGIMAGQKKALNEYFQESNRTPNAPKTPAAGAKTNPFRKTK